LEYSQVFASLKKFFLYLFIALMIVAVFFALFYVFWLLFIKVDFKDIPAQWRKKLEISAKLAPNEMLGRFFLSGDEKHNRLNYGKYMNLRITIPKLIKEPVMEKAEKGKEPIQKVDERNKPVFKEFTEELPIDCFIIEKKGFFAKLFGDPIFILCFPQDHDFSSIFNDVVVRGFNIVPLDNYFYTIDKHNMDIDMHKAIEGNYIKEALVEQYRDLDKLVKGAINLDSKFTKEKDARSEFELPQLDKLKGDQR
jgi:hypothetical protein